MSRDWLFEEKMMEKVISEKVGIRNLALVLIYFILGYVTHLSVFLYKLGTKDSNVAGMFHYTPDWEATLGRFMIKPIDAFNSYLSVPMFTCTVAILLFAVGACLVLNILELDDLIYQIVVGGILVVNPCVGFTLTGFYCCMDYALSYILACLFAYFIKKEMKVINAIVAGIMLVLTLAIYQAYLGVAVSLCLFIIIFSLVKGEEIFSTLKKGIYMAIVGGVSTIAYYITMNIVLKCMNLEVSGYGGADSIFKTTILDLKIAIAVSYQDFIFYLADYAGVMSPHFYRGKVYFVVLVALFVASLITLIVKKQLYKEPIRVVGIGLLTILFPIAACVIMFVVKGRGMHMFMVQSLFLVFVLFGVIVYYFQNEYEGKRVGTIVGALFLIITFLYGYEMYAINNATYEYNHMIRNNMVSSAERILAEAEQLEGYETESEFCFAGYMVNSYPVYTYLEQMAYPGLTTLDCDIYRFNQAIIENIYREDIGCWLTLCNEEKYSEIVSSQEFKEMPVYPNNGSVKMLNGYVVVKMEEKPPMPE